MRAVETKAVRLVLDKRVEITWQSEDGQAANGTVEGDTGTYQAAFSPAGYICTCPAGTHHRPCSHALAVELEVRTSQSATVGEKEDEWQHI